MQLYYGINFTFRSKGKKNGESRPSNQESMVPSAPSATSVPPTLQMPAVPSSTITQDIMAPPSYTDAASDKSHQMESPEDEPPRYSEVCDPKQSFTMMTVSGKLTTRM